MQKKLMLRCILYGTVTLILLILLGVIGLRLYGLYCSLKIPTAEDQYGKKSNYTLLNNSTNDPTTNILIISDLHFGRGKETTLSYKPYEDFIAWFSEQTATTVPYTQILNLGDSTDNSTAAQYKEAYMFMNKLKTISPSSKIFVLAGNHDGRHGGRKIFHTLFGNFYEAEFVNGISFYLIDSSEMFVDWTQMEKLKSAVRNDKNPKIFLTHIPLTSHPLTKYYMSNGSKKQRKEFISLILKNKVSLYLAGHRHKEEGPIEYCSTCRELTLASMNGRHVWFESRPTWYVLSYAAKQGKSPNTIAISRFIWYAHGDIRESKVGTFNMP